MARQTLPALTPEQVVDLYDALLSNANALHADATALLEAGRLDRAWSLAVLGLEESGKAIAIQRRRDEIGRCPEGESFVNDQLNKVWWEHKRKLELAHDFLIHEEFWFDVAPPEPHPLLTAAPEDYPAALNRLANVDNTQKMRGFYVDLTDSGDVLEPARVDPEAEDKEVREAREEVAATLDAIHQIGWQIRLGDHILAKVADQHAASGHELHNNDYRLRLPEPGSNPFAGFGAAGHEAETRELLALAASLKRGDDDAGDAPAGETPDGVWEA